MRLAIASALTVTLVSVTSWPYGPCAAAEGDRWAIDRQNVNVRSGPSTSSEVLMTINAGEEIVEVASKGEWFFVEFPNRNKRGWVFGPLLISPEAVSTSTAAATPSPSVETATPSPEPATSTASVETTTIATETVPATPATDIGVEAEPEARTQTAAVSVDDEPAAVKSFRDTVEELNNRAVSVAGINLFSDVRSTGDGGVQVLATETWESVPEAGQTSYMNALFDRWQSVANGLGPLSLQIVDPSGQVMMERSGS